MSKRGRAVGRFFDRPMKIPAFATTVREAREVQERLRKTVRQVPLPADRIRFVGAADVTYIGEIDTVAAAVITNDSDLLEPIRIIRSEMNVHIGILNPHTAPSRALIKYASFVKQIRRGVLSVSQFPPQLRDEKGVFHKPMTW